MDSARLVSEQTLQQPDELALVSFCQSTQARCLGSEKLVEHPVQHGAPIVSQRKLVLAGVLRIQAARDQPHLMQTPEALLHSRLRHEHLASKLCLRNKRVTIGAIKRREDIENLP